MISLLLTAALSLSDVSGAVWKRLEVPGRAPLDYAVLTPEGLDAGREHPVLLALPPGGGGRDMVERGLELYFASEALRRGWIVVSPAAPDGAPFHAGGEAWIPALLDAVGAAYAVEGGTFHLAGVSNGGRGAFRVAGLHAEWFASLSGLPAVPPEGTDSARLAQVATLPTALYVGAEDPDWLQASREAVAALHAVGAARVSLEELAGEGHVLDSALSVTLFDRLDALRAEQRERDAVCARVAAVLDDLHHAAAVADEDRYFDLFLPEAVFVGTDATERWTLAQFRAYSERPFERDSAWIYEPLERHVELSLDGRTAWFYERLANKSYGETRGSGTLVLRGERWRIAQYVLSFTVPNDAAKEVVEAIAGTVSSAAPGSAPTER